MLHRAAAFVRSGSQKHHALQRETRKTRSLLYLAFRILIALLCFVLRRVQRDCVRQYNAMRCTNKRYGAMPRNSSHGLEICRMIPACPRNAVCDVAPHRRDLLMFRQVPQSLRRARTVCMSGQELAVGDTCQHVPTTLTHAGRRQRCQPAHEGAWRADGYRLLSAHAYTPQHIPTPASRSLPEGIFANTYRRAPERERQTGGHAPCR